MYKILYFKNKGTRYKLGVRVTIYYFFKNYKIFINLQCKLKMAPRAIGCYICGKQIGIHSYKFHIKQCSKLFKNRGEKIPNAPPGLGDDFDANNFTASSNNNNGLDELNAAASASASSNLAKCQFCGRSFLPEKLLIHNKSCTSKKPARAVNDPINRRSAMGLNSVTGTANGASPMSSPVRPRTSENNKNKSIPNKNLLRKSHDGSTSSSKPWMHKNKNKSIGSSTLPNPLLNTRDLIPSDDDDDDDDWDDDVDHDINGPDKYIERDERESQSLSGNYALAARKVNNGRQRSKNNSGVTNLPTHTSMSSFSSSSSNTSSKLSKETILMRIQEMESAILIMNRSLVSLKRDVELMDEM